MWRRSGTSTTTAQASAFSDLGFRKGVRNFVGFRLVRNFVVPANTRPYTV